MFATATEPATEAAEPATPRPSHKLFSRGDVALATFLGSILAGTIVLAINYSRLGRPRAARLSIVCGAIGLAIMLVAVFAAPDVGNGVFTAINLGLTFAMRSLTDVLQGPAMAEHKRSGGQVGAGWKAAGIGLASMVGVVGVIVVLMLQFDPTMNLGDSVEVGKITVYYKDGGTEAEARKVGEHLRAEGVHSEMDIQILRRDGVPHILFIADNGKEADAFREVGRSIAIAVFSGAPVVIDLADQELDIHTSIPVDPP